jgi:hypothetical protein
LLLTVVLLPPESSAEIHINRAVTFEHESFRFFS